MLTYPVYFPRSSYRGSKESLRRKAAETNHLIKQVEAYVNEQASLRSEPFHLYSYTAIADTLRLDRDDVRKHCMVDGGHNGFTVVRPGLTMDQAFAEAEADAAKVAKPAL